MKFALGLFLGFLAYEFLLMAVFFFLGRDDE